MRFPKENDPFHGEIALSDPLLVAPERKSRLMQTGFQFQPW
jgi:hypothetical protein